MGGSITLYRYPHSRLAWTVAVNLREGYAWYSIKDQSVLPHTVMWMENRGRHGAPWNGRNSCLGLEETCSYFAAGLAAPDDGGVIGSAGIPTAVDLQPDEPLVVRTIQGVFAVDDPEIEIVALDESGVFVDHTGRRYELATNPEWVLAPHDARRRTGQ